MPRGVFYILSTLLFFSCSPKNGSESTLPDDFIISFVDKDFNKQRKAEFYITKDSIQVVFINKNIERRYLTEVSPDTLSRLYQFMMDKSFERIIVINDSDDIGKFEQTISLIVSGDEVIKSNGNGKIIQSIWQKTFLEIRNKIILTSYNQFNEQKVNVSVIVDSNVYKRGVLNFNTDQLGISYTGLRDSNRTEQRKFKILPGKYIFNASLHERLNSTFQIKRLSDCTKSIDFKEGTKVLLKLSDGELEVLLYE